MTIEQNRQVSVGMIGLGMIFDETYLPLFRQFRQRPLYDRSYGAVDVVLQAVASRTGRRVESLRNEAGSGLGDWISHQGSDCTEQLLKSDISAVCIATPDNRHFDSAKAAILAGKHVLIEKPSVLSLQELDELVVLAEKKQVLARVVYHKLFDPDHRQLRTLIQDGLLKHVNNGYCTLLEPKSISGQQFAEWISGRNPATYVAVHYIKLIDFTFGGRLVSIRATGQRGLVGTHDGPTWDSVQLQLVYEFPSGRDAAFDIHTSWVNPDNFPGYVEQEVQFRFDNGVWNAHQRKRGIECTIEGLTPTARKSTINTHYNATAFEPWGERVQKGYGLLAIERFFHEVALLEFGGPSHERPARLHQLRQQSFSDLSSDYQVVAAVQGLEAILAEHAAGRPNAIANYNAKTRRLDLLWPGSAESRVLFDGT